MNILVINSGSSSLKFQLIDMATQAPRCKGLLERIGIADGIFSYEPAGKPKRTRSGDIPDHAAGIAMALEALTDPADGVIRSLAEIGAVGHRIVHGGEKIKKSERLDDDVVAIVRECSKLAPLHNPPNLTGFEAVRRLLPDVPHVGVFDTAFHATMPPHAYVYALDYEYYERHGIRRFGFHGASHQYVAMRAAAMLGVPLADFRCVTCHMGNGVSLAAVCGGRSLDTSLGFGTMCGVPMGTRAGDVDPAVILHLIDHLGMSSVDVHNLLYRRSGLKGLGGRTPDMRDVETAAAAGDARAQLALDVFCHAARKYVAALATSLQGRLDAVVFTAGIGENSPAIRAGVCRGLEFMGVQLDAAANQVRGREALVSAAGSPVKVMVVPTNEELMIALETQRVVAGAA